MDEKIIFKMWTRYVILLIRGTSVLERSMTMGDVLIKARTRNSGKVVYEYRFEVASIDGKRQWKSKSGFATKREAREAGKIAQKAYEHVGQVVEPLDINSLPEDEKIDQKLVRKRASELGKQLGKTILSSQ